VWAVRATGPAEFARAAGEARTDVEFVAVSHDSVLYETVTSHHPDGTATVTWLLAAPGELDAFLDAGATGVAAPAGVMAVATYLAGHLGGGTGWDVRCDRGWTHERWIEQQLRAAWQPLLAVVEPAVLGLRSDAAIAAGDAVVHARVADDSRMAGTYSIRLWQRAEGGWATLHVGVRAPVALAASRHGALRRLATGRIPLLTVPVPRWPVYAARLDADRGTFLVTRVQAPLLAQAARDLVLAHRPAPTR
jgi:hypothetical protein